MVCAVRPAAIGSGSLAASLRSSQCGCALAAGAASLLRLPLHPVQGGAAAAVLPPQFLPLPRWLFVAGWCGCWYCAAALQMPPAAAPQRQAIWVGLGKKAGVFVCCFPLSSGLVLCGALVLCCAVRVGRSSCEACPRVARVLVCSGVRRLVNREGRQQLAINKNGGQAAAGATMVHFVYTTHVLL